MSDDISNSLNSINYFGIASSSALSSKKANEKEWCAVINYLCEIHYDFCGKPNVISLCFEYLTSLQIVPNNFEIRMALFEAVKFDQGYQLNMSKLFGSKAIKELDWLRSKEIEFCNKLEWKFAVSTKYQMLMTYLQRFGFDTNCIVSKDYKNVKIEFKHYPNRYKEACFDNVKFGFLCRYLLEMSYYKMDFCKYSKKELIVCILFSAFIIAKRWTQKFDFDKLKNTKFIKKILGNLDNLDLISDIIRLARTPHSCFLYCAEDKCGCTLNCSTNTYLKYGKLAFCEIAKVPCLSTVNIEVFAHWLNSNSK